MSKLPDAYARPDASDNAIAEAYRKAREEPGDPIFADAATIELGPTGREWSMISLIDLQTAIALGRRD